MKGWRSALPGMAVSPVLRVFCVIELVGPAMEEVPHVVDVGAVDGEFVVGEAVDGPHHFGEDERVESEVDLGCTLNEYGLVEALCERKDVSEIACLGTIEQRHQLSSGEFLRIECGSDDRDDRGSSRWGVDGDVDKHFVTPDTRSRANVSLSWMRVHCQPCSAVAASN